MKIAFLGDIALFGRNTVFDGSYKKKYEPIIKYLKQYDMIVANLESPLTNLTKTVGGKSAYLKSDPKNVEILLTLGVTQVSLANNHMFDYRAEGLADTINILEKNNIGWYGANSKTLSVRMKNNNLFFAGYCCYSTNGKGLNAEKKYINSLKPYDVEIDINSAEENRQLPIISLHWGQEHIHYPNYDHILFARKLCKNREIIIHGHHPHVLQGIEKIGNSIVAYSLGNCCFDDIYTSKSKAPLIKLSQANQESMILIVEVENNKISNFEIIPFSFYDGVYNIRNDLRESVNEYISFLRIPKEEYIEKRLKLLEININKRKELRDFLWYWKRLNIESLKMIISGKQNQKKYNQLIKTYIKNF